MCWWWGGGGANRINKRREYSPLPCTSVKQVTHVLPLNRIIKIRRQTQGDIDGLDSLKATRPTRKILARCFPAILEIFRPSVVLSGPKKKFQQVQCRPLLFSYANLKVYDAVGDKFLFLSRPHRSGCLFWMRIIGFPLIMSFGLMMRPNKRLRHSF